MNDKKVTELIELEGVGVDTSIYVIDNPLSFPVSKKSTAQNVVKGGASEGAIADIVDTTLSASKNLVSDAQGKITTTSDVFCRWRGIIAGNPGSNREGDIYIDSSDSNKVKIYNGTSYVNLT